LLAVAVVVADTLALVAVQAGSVQLQVFQLPLVQHTR
jgi:hypothetical protein